MEDKNKTEGIYLDLTGELTIDDSRSRKIDHDVKYFAEVSSSGKLIKFDNQLCRKIADNPDMNGGIVNGAAVLSIILLEKAAEQVDHILKEGGGTYGDLIRNLNINIDSTHEEI